MVYSDFYSPDRLSVVFSKVQMRVEPPKDTLWHYQSVLGKVNVLRVSNDGEPRDCHGLEFLGLSSRSIEVVLWLLVSSKIIHCNELWAPDESPPNLSCDP